MKNEVVFEGNVLNCYIDDQTGALIVKMAVYFGHHVGKHLVPTESVFKIVMAVKNAIKNTDIRQGQYVRMIGYVKIDFKFSDRGNKHDTIRIYALKYEVL